MEKGRGRIVAINFPKIISISLLELQFPSSSLYIRNTGHKNGPSHAHDYMCENRLVSLHFF